jgi:hypothetical protein
MTGKSETPPDGSSQKELTRSALSKHLEGLRAAAKFKDGKDPVDRKLSQD